MPVPAYKKRKKPLPHIIAHILTPAGLTREYPVKNHNRFNYEKGTYSVMNVFSSEEGDRMMLVSIGNPIPDPDNGATSADAMESQYLSTLIDDLSRPAAQDFGGIFERIMHKFGIIPPALVVLLIVVIVVLTQGGL